MPSEQPREGTRVEGCQHDSTRVDGWLDDCCLRCGASGYFKDGHYVDPTGKQTKGHPSGKTLIWPEPAQPEQPRGEGDDLAARLEARADNADKMAAEVARNPSNYGESGPRHHARLLAAAYAFRKAARLARASTHPEQANGLKQLYEVDGIFLGKCKNITLYQCENVAINSSANVNIGDCMIEHLTHNNIEHEQDNLHKSPAPEGEGEAG